MLNPLELTTTGLIVAITNQTLPEEYREACVAELAGRIDHHSTAQQPVLVVETARAAVSVAA